MAKGNGSTQATTSGWTSTQAYVFAVICLAVGVLAGYLLRGSGTTAPVETSAASSGAATAPTGGVAANGQPTPEQMKHMADTQAEPLLAKLKSEPNNAELLANVGNLYYDAQQYKDAVDYYGRALKLTPNNVNVRTDMGTAYFYLGDSDRALSEFQTALQSDPKHGQTMYNIGMVKWQGKGDAPGAVATWEKLLQTVPDYPDRAKVEQLISRAKQHSTMAPGTKTSKPASM